MRQAQQPTKNGKRRRNFFLSDQVMERVRAFADRKGLSMARVLETAATKYIDAVEKAEGTGR